MQLWFKCPLCSVVDDAYVVKSTRIVIDGTLRRTHVVCVSQRRSRLAAGITTVPSDQLLKQDAAE